MSKKDSYWFRHDASAGRGLKMRKMAHIYTHWGKGVYWDVVEILRDQKEYKFECDESSLQLLCDLIGCKSESRFISWFNDCLNIGLFMKESNYFICPPLSENMVRWETSKSNGSKGGRPPKKHKNNLNDNLKKTIIGDNSIEHKEVYTPPSEIEILKPYEIFKNNIKKGKYQVSVESWLRKLKGDKNKLNELLLHDFKTQLLNDTKKHQTAEQVKSHFGAWLNIYINKKR